MNVPTRPYHRALLSFALAVLVSAVVASFVHASAPHRSTHEFPEPLGAFFFGLFVWGGALNLLGTVGFSLGLAPVLGESSPLPVPVVVGSLGGLVTFAAAGLGLPGLAGMQGPFGIIVSAFLVGLSFAFLVLLHALVRRGMARGA